MVFLEALKKAKLKHGNIVIPDVKCRSPKEGDLMRGRNPAEYARALISAGAPVLSVVTEGERFGGSEELLREIASLGVPVLRKDFLETREDIIRTKELGASAVLLMYSCLTPEKLEDLYSCAKSIGLDVLAETHNEDELARAYVLGAELVGINNRDIRVLERDDGTVSLTQTLAGRKPENVFLVSESAISSPDDVRRAVSSGADAALVGTALLRSENPYRYYRKLCRGTQIKLCGMMSGENIAQCAEADILGFVTDYPAPVPWNLTAEETEKLLPLVPSDCQTCVVTGGTPEKVLALAGRLRPDMLQLHYRESLSETAEIAGGLKKLGIPLIRSVPVTKEERKAQFGVSDLKELASALENVGVSALLIDSRAAGNAARSDGLTPLQEYKELCGYGDMRVILAGGITPDNLAGILRQTGAEYIDIMTGIEDRPGIKLPEKLRQVFEITGGQNG